MLANQELACTNDEGSRNDDAQMDWYTRRDKIRNEDIQGNIQAALVVTR